MNGDAVRGARFLSSILCVVDFSESSKRSIEWSVQMALLLNLHITLLHTFRLLQDLKGEVLLMKRMKEEECTAQFKELEKTLLINREITYDFRTEIGFLSDRIEHFTKENRNFLVVINKSVLEENKETFQEMLLGIHVAFVIIPS